MTNTLPSLQKFEEYRAMGLVQKREHKELPLSIYTYTLLTNYERLWNSVTKSARGIVFDDKGRCVVRCLPKFFNEDEPHATCEMDLKTKPVYFNKLDGSLIQVVNDPEYGLVVTSKGSFHSNQSHWATEYISSNHKPEDFEEGLTYVFELIHPDNRIVIDYGDTFELYLLAVIDIATGEELDISSGQFDKFKTVDMVDDLERHLGSDLVEGVVAKVDEHRFKIKTGEYIRLHRIVTEFTPKRVWEALSTGQSLEFQDMPEEFQTWLDTTIEDLQTAYGSLTSEIMSEFEETKAMDNKELGLSSYKFKHFIFALRNKKDISPEVWKQIKPKGEGPVL